MESVLGQSLTQAILRASVFGQFGGKDTDKELRDKVELFARRKVGVAFAYTSEPFKDTELLKLSPEQQKELMEAKCAKVFDHCLMTIDNAARYVNDGSRFVSMKVASIVDGKLLRRLTTLLNYSDEVFKSYSTTSTSNGIPNISSSNMSFKSQVLRETLTELSTKGYIDLVDWRNHFSAENVDQLHLLLKETLPGVERPAPLSHQEHQQVKVLLKRLSDMGERAATKNVRVLVDAEQTYYQPAISSLTVHYLMKNFNKEQPTIYDTVQSYLKSSHQTMLFSHLSTERNNCIYAVKLVRGAYMDEEKRLATQHGYEDPVHDSKEETSDSYHKNMGYVLSQDGTFLCVASHNSETVDIAKEWIAAHKISPQSGQVVFSQSMGMADYLSLTLGQEGYLVYKMFHHGKYRGVLPYLVRRGLENRGAMLRGVEEQEMLRKEIIRRILSPFIITR
ncbi:proline dehydrogenase 1, mitochondrial-like isoform X2 [Dysidea avara]